MGSRADLHPTDEELLLALESDALEPAVERRVRHHVAGCHDCSIRARRLSQELGEVVSVCAGADQPPSGLDARVRTRLGAESRVARWWSPPVASRWAVAATAVLALWFFDGGSGPGGRLAGVAAPGSLPRPELTPGSVRPVTADEICGRGLSDAGTAPVAAPVPREVFEAYGLDFQAADQYELDFLVTPELGGAAVAANLWPQPYQAGPWNAHVKDELERHLVRLVCGGRMDLGDAQRELATDWVAAYKRHFRTRVPLRDYARTITDPLNVGSANVEL